jgi:HAD superfamily hydrolase (TIGR01509 family)
MPSSYEAVEAVLFDFAGTLFMPRDASELVLEAARTLGLDLCAEDCLRLAERCVAAGFPGGPYPDAVPDHLAEVYQRRDLSSDAHRAAYVGLLSSVEHPHPDLPAAIYEHVRQPEGWVPYADTYPVIKQLDGGGIRVGVISNVGFDLRPILRAHGLEQLARGCTMSYEVGVAKPDPRIFRAALRALGSDASSALMVGDHETVDRGGEALGIHTVILPMTAPGSEHGLSRVLELL